jgi:hypothetical protein
LFNPPGHLLTKKGYWRIYTPTAHKNKYLHRWVIERLTGEKPGPDKEVHHIDLDPKNCCPYNLAVMDYDLHQALDNSSRLGLTKGIQGFRKRPGANEEVDRLVVEMIVADWQGKGKTWSVMKELERMQGGCQRGLFDGDGLD